MESLEKELGEMTTHITNCENKLAMLEPENNKLKADIESMRSEMKSTIFEASETAAEEVRCLKVKFRNSYKYNLFNLMKMLLL